MPTTQTEVRISHLPGATARQALADNPAIILPMGSHEDQGPHFPMGDYLLPERIAELAAQAAHQRGFPAYVMPVLPYGGDDFFGSAKGGAILSPATMTAVLLDVINSLIDNGLTRIILVNGHSGNVGPVLTAMRETRRNRGVAVPGIYLWEVAYGLLPGIVGADQAARRSGHGGDPLGSVGLHLLPELIDPALMPEPRAIKPDPVLGLPSTNLGRVKLGEIDIGVWNDYADIFNDGMNAVDPRLCDAETGRILTGKLVDAIAGLAEVLITRA